MIIGVLLMTYIQSALQNTTMTLGIDLYPRWVGAQAVLAGQSPYSFETRQMIWRAVYGSPVLPTGNPFGFYYPPAITTILFPFILAGVSLKTAAIFWCAFIWALWSVALLYWIMITGMPQEARILTISLLLISGIVFRPAYSNYLLGQYSLFSVLMLVFTWFALKNKYVILAGVFAAFCLIKFSLTILPLALLFIIYFREWKALLAFVITSILLYLPPTLMLGWWVPDFINDISRYASENAVAWSWADVGSVAGIGWLIISLAMLFRSLKLKDFDLAVSTMLALNAIFVPHTADYDLVSFIPLIFLFGNRLLRSKGPALWFSMITFGFILWFPWISLIFFIAKKVAVENWYHFIWLVYPFLIVATAFLYDTFKNSSGFTRKITNQI